MNNKALITPFNVFSALSFVLLALVAWLAHGYVNRLVLASASAVLGFLLIIMFLVWTLFERED